MNSMINLKNKKGIILGIANEKSIAWGIAEKLSECGAQLAFSYVNESIKKRLKPLAEKEIPSPSSPALLSSPCASPSISPKRVGVPILVIIFVIT